jgi:hypothetical protein
MNLNISSTWSQVLLKVLENFLCFFGSLELVLFFEELEESESPVAES